VRLSLEKLERVGRKVGTVGFVSGGGLDATTDRESGGKKLW